MTTVSFIQSSLQQALKEVPEKIRDWFGSEKVTNLVIDLNKEIGIEGEEIRIIPKLLLRLEVKDLEPQNFTQELSSQLNVDYETTKSIAREIKKQILEPISQILLRWEVDINRIAVGGLLGLAEIKLPTIKKETEIKSVEPKPATGPKPLEISELFKTKNQPPATLPITQTVPTVPETQKIPTTQQEAPTTQPKVPAEPLKTIPTTTVPTDKSFDKIQDKPFNETQDKPFMIHQETESRPLIEKNKTTTPIIGWFQKAMPGNKTGLPAGRQEKPKMPETPIKVELETFGQKIEESFGTAQGKEKEPPVARTEAPKQKIVHYREVEMPTPFGKTPASAEASADAKALADRSADNRRQGEPFITPPNKPLDTIQGKPGVQLPKEIPPQKIETPAIKIETIKPFDTVQKSPFDITQGKPFGTAQGGPAQTPKPETPPTPFSIKTEPPKPFGVAQGKPFGTTPQDKLEPISPIPPIKPEQINQPPAQPPQPTQSTPLTDSTIIDLDSFELTKEENTINLKGLPNSKPNNPTSK